MQNRITITKKLALDRKEIQGSPLIRGIFIIKNKKVIIK